MHLYKQYWKLLMKNKTSLIIYSIITIVMIVLVAMMAVDKISGNGNESFRTSIDMSYIDKDNSALSKGIIEYFSKNNNCMNFEGKTDEQINDMAYFTITQFHMNIPENFQLHLNAEKNINIEYVASADNASYASTCANDIDAFVNCYLSYKKLGFSDEEAVSRTIDGMTQDLDISTYTEKEEITAVTAAEAAIYQMTLYLFYISFGIICLTGGMAIVKTNENIIRNRIAAAPVSAERQTLANTLGIYSFGLLLWALFTVVMYLVGRESATIADRGWLISLGVLVMIIVNCSLAVLIAAFGPKSNTLSMVVNVVGLASSFLGGVFVPQWLLGEEVLRVAKFIPSYWFTYALNSSCNEIAKTGVAFDKAEIFKCYGIELAFALALVMIAIVVKKTRAQR